MNSKIKLYCLSLTSHKKHKIKKTLLLGIFGIALLASCGGAKEEENKEPSVCDCINAKGAPPAGCDKVAGGMSEEEFEKAYNECKGNESPEE